MKMGTDMESYWDTEDRNPHPFYDALRARGDVVWDNHIKAWLVTGAAANRAVLMDDSTYIQPYLSMKAGEGYRALRLNNPRSFHFLTGEEHRAMHRWWLMDLLSPQWVAEYMDTVVTPIIGRILSSLEGREEFDIADEYAERIPVAIFADLMDLPDRTTETLARIKKLNDRIADFATIANSLKLEGEPTDELLAVQRSAIAASEELNEMLRPVVEERKERRGEDFVSRLWAGGPALYEDWNSTDVLDASRRLLFAGSDTTTLSIANAFYMLLTDESLLQQVRAGGRPAIAKFVEEVLRLNGSVQFRPRRAMKDVELAGQKIAKGDMVIAVLQAANRDPAHFACPHVVNLDRKAIRAHFAFNVGPRSCPGSNLARAELVESIAQMLNRYTTIRLVNPGEPVLRGFMFRSY
ncbi:MAG: cytochrome P450, partial [Nitrospira sp.]|nr:cytochrome P450 [Nitrospira sp.]